MSEKRGGETARRNSGQQQQSNQQQKQQQKQTKERMRANELDKTESAGDTGPEGGISEALSLSTSSSASMIDDEPMSEPIRPSLNRLGVDGEFKKPADNVESSKSRSQTNLNEIKNRKGSSSGSNRFESMDQSDENLYKGRLLNQLDPKHTSSSKSLDRLYGSNNKILNNKNE